MANALEFTCGETIVVAIAVTTGDITLASSPQAQLRPGRRGTRTVAPGAPLAAEFIITSRALIGTTPAGWDLTLSDITSAALSSGVYFMDFRCQVGGSVIYAPIRQINLIAAVTHA